MRKSVAVVSGFAVTAITVGAILSIAASYDNEAHVAGPQRPDVTKTQTAAEREDLIRFELDNRSNEWVTDIWLVWEITNHSSQKSDYHFEWEAVNTQTKKRVASGTEFENNVLPGQTAKGEMFTTLRDTRNIKINITDFDRTKSW